MDLVTNFAHSIHFDKASIEKFASLQAITWYFTVYRKKVIFFIVFYKVYETYIILS